MTAVSSTTSSPTPTSSRSSATPLIPHDRVIRSRATCATRGFRVIPVNPLLRGAVINGERAYDRLADIPKSEHVDFVDVFRRGEFLDAVVDDAREAGVKVLWFQLDLGNVAAAERAEAAGMRVVWDRCTAIEHRRIRRSAAPRAPERRPGLHAASRS